MQTTEMWEDLSQNVWKKYGFKGNPFDTKALSASPDDPIPVTEALVGRELASPESRLLTNILRIPGGGRIVVEGEIGVGKTTFVNYHRFLWEYKAQDKLFTPLREISIVPEWKVKDFLINVLGALIMKLLRLKGPKLVKNNPLLQEILALSKVFLKNSWQIQGSILGVGGGFGTGEEVSVPQPSEAILLYYLENLVPEIKKLGYAGIMLHFDDLELISRRDPQAIRYFLEDIRNILQTPDIYYIFVGHPGFFSEIISPLERVRSIFFGYPVYLPPLTKAQASEVINRRYQILAIQPQKFIKPVEDAFIANLYDLYDGRMRFIMDAMTLIVPELPGTQTFSSTEAAKILKRLVNERVQRVLPTRELQFLRSIASRDNFTNQEAGHLLGLTATNVSHFLAHLQELNFVYLYRQVGRNRYYKVSEDIKIIKDMDEIALPHLPKHHVPHIPKRSLRKVETADTRKLSRKTRERLSLALHLLKTKGRLTCKEYEQHVPVSSASARRDLATLVASKEAHLVGKGRNAYYVPDQQH